MKKSIVLLSIGVITLFASSKDVCYNVEILKEPIASKNSADLEKQVFEDNCKIIEIKKNYAVRCGCYTAKKDVIAEYHKLKDKYQHAKITRSYAYRFKEEIEIKEEIQKSEKIVESEKKPIVEVEKKELEVEKKKIVIKPDITKTEVPTKSKKVIKKVKEVEEIEEVEGVKEVKAEVLQDSQVDDKIVKQEDKNETVDTADNEPKHKSEPKQVSNTVKNAISISTSLSYSMLDIDIENSNKVIYDENIKLDLISFGLGADYCFDDISIGLDYQYAQNSQMRYHNIFTTVSYLFNNLFASPYIGILAGYSNMKWEDYPLKEIKARDSSWSLISGFELGGKIGISKSIDFYTQYRYLFMDFKSLTNEGSKTTSINIKGSGSFIFGFSYKL